MIFINKMASNATPSFDEMAEEIKRNVDRQFPEGRLFLHLAVRINDPDIVFFLGGDRFLENIFAES